MNLSLRLLLAASLLLTALSAVATPREDVKQVAQAIEDRFYDPARAASIATHLRNAADEGKFDSFTDPRELATVLSQQLKPLDAHFNVRWSAPEATPAHTSAGLTPRRRAPSGNAGNHGIRRVEILPGNIGYLDLRQFAHFEFGQPAEPARQAIEAALQLVAGTDAMIIDLRANGGGSPAMVGYLSSAFTPKGAGIYNTFHSRRGTASEAPQEWYPRPRLEVPLYILTSGRTGSAAEAFAYTMKNAKRATLVGEASGGAANPGGEVQVGNGFSVFVSDGSPVSPITRTNWEGSGVIPTVEASSEAAFDVARELALKAIIAGAPAPGPTEARWALEALHAQVNSNSPSSMQDYLGTYGVLDIGQMDGQLFLKRGRRPKATLLPLSQDVFTVATEPSQRVTFHRDNQGKVIALETSSADGQSARYRRGD